MSEEHKQYDSSSDEDADFEDWNSEDADTGVTSFFPPHKSLKDAEEAWEELRMHTGFDFSAFKSSKGLSPHHCIRIVNYIRNAIKNHENDESADFRAIAIDAVRSITDAVLADERWLIPVIPDDAMLMAVIDESDDDDSEIDADAAVAGGGAAPSMLPPRPAYSTEPTTLEEAKAIIQGLTDELKRATQLLNSFSMEDEISASESAVTAPKFVNPTSSGVDVRQDNDSYYFESYEKSGIHREMIGDRVRTEWYRDAIFASDMKGKTVIDVGCGTGILSLFCANNGAEKVIALDASNIIEDATAIIAANGKADIVTAVRGLAESVDLSSLLGGKRADFIVSEWMGYGLLYESMLNSVLIIRDKYLNPGGCILPATATILLAAIIDETYWKQKIGFWDDVYGFNMSVMAKHEYKDAVVEVIPAAVIGTPFAVKKFDILTMKASEQDLVQQPFEVACSGDKVWGLALWFDVGAVGQPIPDMPTGPTTTPTHWMQTAFLFQDPPTPDADRVLRGVFSMTRDPRNPREYRFIIEVHKNGKSVFTQSYRMK